MAVTGMAVVVAVIVVIVMMMRHKRLSSYNFSGP
jgi:hypothetical protein